MADVEEPFLILKDASGLGVAPDKTVEGDASASSKIGMVAFTAKDASGNVAIPQMRELQDPVIATDKGVITNTVIHGKTTAGGGSYVDVKVNPSGALVTDSSGSTSEVQAYTMSGSYPDPASYDTLALSTVLVDQFRNLQIRGPVISDELSFRDDFPGTALTTTLTGTLSFTNGSLVVTGSGTTFTTEVKSGQYIRKSADALTLALEVDSVDSDTQITLVSAYAGTTASTTAVINNWFQANNGGGTQTVASSIVSHTTNNGANSEAYIFKRADYLPFTLNSYAALTARNTNQTSVIGFQDIAFAPTKSAYVSFSGTTNTQCQFITQSSTAASDTQTTTVTLPSGAVTSSFNYYKIDLSANRAVLSINNVIVATHDQHLPGPYDSLGIISGIKNTAASTGASLQVDFNYFANWDRLQIDNDFQGEPIAVKNQIQSALTYAAAATNITMAASATDVFTITGSATKTVKVRHISVSGTATTATNRTILLIKRSTANSGGTSTTLTKVPFDSQNAAATAVCRSYTANPTLGTTVGTIHSEKLFISTDANPGGDEWIYDSMVDGEVQNITLRGTGEVLAVNFNAVTTTGNIMTFDIVWTEE